MACLVKAKIESLLLGEGGKDEESIHAEMRLEREAGSDHVGP